MKPIQRVFEEVPSGQTRHYGLFTPCTLSPCSHEVAIFGIVRRGLVWQVARSRCSRFSMIHVIPLSASEKPHGDSPASYVFCSCCVAIPSSMKHITPPTPSSLIIHSTPPSLSPRPNTRLFHRKRTLLRRPDRIKAEKRREI